MDINSRFSKKCLEDIEKILEENNNKSLILKGTFNDDEIIDDVSFLVENKKKYLNDIVKEFKRDEIFIRISKTNQLYPSDLELEISEELYNKKNVAFCLISKKLDDFYFVQDIDRINLNEIDIKPYFEENGIISKNIKNFEYREEQEQMALSVQKAINKNTKLIIEAGTGTGKTLAYLIPAIKWAVENKKKVIIATNTINLQEQLLHKDIPLVKNFMNKKFSYTLIKGRNNYLCKRLFNEVALKKNINLEAFNYEQKEELSSIIKWGLKSHSGDKAELPFEVNSDVWELFQSTTELCIGKKCPFRSECFYMKTRREKLDADILISNHHIFFADLNIRSNTDFDSEYLILPKYDMVIFDEAHNIESVARSYFSIDISKFGFTRLLNKIYSKTSNKRRQKSVLTKLEESIEKKNIENLEFFNTVLENLKNGTAILQESGSQYFESIQKTFDNGQEMGIKKTLSVQEIKRFNFLKNTETYKENFYLKLKEFLNLMSDMARIIHDEKDKNPDIPNFINHFNIFKNFIENFRFVNDFSDEDYIYWLDINSKRTNIILTATPLNIATKLNSTLFDNINRLIFASATLSADNNFKYFKNSVGLIEENCIEKIISSPFDYDEQMQVFIPSNIQDSDKITLFYEDISNFIFKILEKTKGKAFILFTSYSMLNHVYYSIKNKLEKYEFEVFLHGQKPRTQLINEFKKAKNPILFGTTSFWEGVDVQGDNLSNIIIVKLPFLVPTDPIVSAISRNIEENGGNSFMDYQLPEALIKFKQGIGRLIRNKSDSGNIFILDNRVIKKRYGALFIKTIPSKNLKILTKNEILDLID